MILNHLDFGAGRPMAVTVRLMTASETDLIIDYFWRSTPEHLESMGVDPTRLPGIESWRRRYDSEFSLPMDQRTSVMVTWLLDDQPVGFSTADKITYGERANMHLHVIDSSHRARGVGVSCVRKSVDIYFETLQLKRLFCEPNAFNVAANRTLQKAGFKYLKSHMTVPGSLNFHQAVTRWVIER
jgi:RimJ/RimL family protein N-acetyltransferase